MAARIQATPNNCRVNCTVIASAAKQSRGYSTRPLDCIVVRDPRNDGQRDAGLLPAIHAAPLPANPKLFRRLDDVAECACIRWDDRDKPGHDGGRVGMIFINLGSDGGDLWKLSRYFYFSK
jgi:hypothetical protein